MMRPWAAAGVLALLLGAGCDGPTRGGLSALERVTLADGAIPVPAGNFTEFHYRLPPNATQTSINGSFVVAAGATIHVLVLDATGFRNFEHHAADAAYYESGNVSRGSFKIVVPNGPRTYHIVLDNAFDGRVDKTVTVHAAIQFRV